MRNPMTKEAVASAYLLISHANNKNPDKFGNITTTQVELIYQRVKDYPVEAVQVAAQKLVYREKNEMPNVGQITSAIIEANRTLPLEVRHESLGGCEKCTGGTVLAWKAGKDAKSASCSMFRCSCEAGQSERRKFMAPWYEGLKRKGWIIEDDHLSSFAAADAAVIAGKAGIH